MAQKLSRRSIATYLADYLINGGQMKQAAKQLAAYLIETKRTNELSIILRDVQFYLAEKGHVTGRVSSAHELSASTLKAIEAYAKQQVGATKVSLEKSVDAGLLGGFKLETPGYQLDETISRKLMILKTRYKKA